MHGTYVVVKNMQRRNKFAGAVFQIYQQLIEIVKNLEHVILLLIPMLLNGKY